MFMVFHVQNEFHPSRLDLRVASAEEIHIRPAGTLDPHVSSGRLMGRRLGYRRLRWTHT